MSVTTGPGVRVGASVRVGPGVSASPVHAGPGIEIGSGSYLPIDTTGTATGFVLVAGPDGIYRPAAPAQQRGSVVHYLTADPTGVPTGVVEGDWVTVIAGANAGTVYHAEET
jgi:hypothetical protein